jgi:hypothetical protein
VNAITPIATKSAEIVEAVITRGDIAQLTPEERAKYYVKVCESIGLNPMTKPFEYITLNGRLVLYARKDATDQLRKLHKISVTELTETEREGVFVVTAKVVNAEGRTDAAKGAVTITGLKGEALANALMKAETKAKRRATLSICGLGFLDETEIEDIPASAKQEAPKYLPKKDSRGIYNKLQAEIDAATSRQGLKSWGLVNAERIKVLAEDWQDILRMRYEEMMADRRQREGSEHDADGVIWDAASERPRTAADEIEPIKTATVKDQLLSEISDLASGQDCLHWGMASHDRFETLNKKDKQLVRDALFARQSALMNGSSHVAS